NRRRFAPPVAPALKEGTRSAHPMHPLASGLAGAVVLTAIHEAARRVISDAPRMDVVGMRAVSRLYGLSGRQPPSVARLYRITLAGDLIANGLYYSAVGTGNPA